MLKYYIESGVKKHTMSIKVLFRKTFFRQLVAVALVACLTHSNKMAYGFTADTSISSDTSGQQKFQTNDNLTLTIEEGVTLTRANSKTINTANSLSGQTVIIKSGATVETTGGCTNNSAVSLANSTNATITNSGTISSSCNRGINATNNATTGMTITNNAGGIITATDDYAIYGINSSNMTITNYGTISVSPSSTAIEVGSDSTIILKEGSLIIGKITSTSTGNKLQFDHGFGRAYFYETTGDFDLEDLSGNKVVKGSAGSVSLGRQETVDEMLGLRAFNLRSALKRYASAPKSSDDNMVWGETFGYSSHRKGTDTLLQHDATGYGMNFIHPVMPKLDLILSVEQNEMEFPEEYDVSRTGFLAGVNVSEISGIGKGNWKLGGFLVAGMGWYDSTREILTNTTSSGLLDVTADYNSVEVMTGLNIKHSYQSQQPLFAWKTPTVNGKIKNRWDTEIGLTLQGSHTGDYNERAYFFFEERTLVQESFHLGEQLTSTMGNLDFMLGLEYEFRLALAGKTQTYRINGTPTDYTDGSFSENSGSGNLGFNYRFGSFASSSSSQNLGVAYIRLNSRLSDQSRFTYGGSVGVRLNF
jgi:hypothetical protein